MSALLEVCCADLDSVHAAANAKAQRIELCAALRGGGVTPSLGMIRCARTLFRATINLLIRPREGNFVYSDNEKKSILTDIETASAERCDGVVIGALTPESTVDIGFCGQAVNLAKKYGLTTTFHRAFDEITDKNTALEQLIGLGFDRILTSGGAQTALEGSETLKELVEKSAGRIIILAGAGVNSSNAANIVATTKCHEIHGSCRRGLSDSSDTDEIRSIITTLNTNQ